jgi:hypothetical protein
MGMNLRQIVVVTLWTAMGILTTRALAGGPTLTPKQLADVSDCEAAISEYNSAISDLSGTLKAYSSCVSDSEGHDDCSLEFSNLQSSQDDFETAVSSYQSDCN